MAKRTFRHFPVLTGTRAAGRRAIELTTIRALRRQIPAAGTRREPGLSRFGTEARAIPKPF